MSNVSSNLADAKRNAEALINNLDESSGKDKEKKLFGYGEEEKNIFVEKSKGNSKSIIKF